MAKTALFEALAAKGARGGEYAGAETAREFGDIAAEYSALECGCGVFDLGWRAKLALTGGDRVRWLNGMVTNNVRDLAPNRGNYSFLLNAQGHILADMTAYNRGEYVLVDTDMSQAGRVKDVFDKFIIMDDVEVTDISDKLTAIGVSGPKSREVMAAAGIQPREPQPGEVEDATWGGMGISVVRGGRENEQSYEIWLAPSNVGSAWEQLLKAGATPAGYEALELWRVAHGIPKYGQDIRERDLPQETEQHQALNFTKGCYVGQEIVERIRSRGAVHRKFAGFRVEGLPATGAKLQAGGKDVGEITSVATLPVNGGHTIALGYVRREVGEPGSEVEADGVKLTVVNLPEK